MRRFTGDGVKEPRKVVKSSWGELVGVDQVESYLENMMVHHGDQGDHGEHDGDLCLHPCQIHQDTFAKHSRLSHIFNTLSQ